MIKIVKDSDHWSKVMQQCVFHDSYHTFEYHQLSKRPEEEPFLFVFQQADIIIALPLLIRNIKDTTYKDATSVYGYAGPACNHNHLNEQVILGFTAGMEEALMEMSIVSVFSRLHSYFPQQLQILQRLGKLEQAGQLVYIDLTKTAEIQLANYNSRLKTQVNKLRRECTVYRVNSESEILEFKKMYYQNMDRVNASESYYFSTEYFMNLSVCREFKANYYLIKDHSSDMIIGGGILLINKQMAQYHLSGAQDDFKRISPTKLLIDQMRVDAQQSGAKYFNLGGGKDGSLDNLFRFKALFSSDYKPFYLWKYIVNPEVYEQLNHRFEKTDNGDYFPAYRS